MLTFSENISEAIFFWKENKQSNGIFGNISFVKNEIQKLN
jgi:hypothetical protein